MPADWYDLSEDELYGDPWDQLREPERFTPHGCTAAAPTEPDEDDAA